MYNFPTNEWTTLPNMQTPRYNHGCGLATKSDGTVEAVVLGGHNINTMEILNLESLTWRWHEANIFQMIPINVFEIFKQKISPLLHSRYATSQLPTDLKNTAPVPFGDSFLIAGGQCNQCSPVSYSKDILKYEPDTETWTMRPEKMATGRSWFGAVLVGHDIVVCA